jgi:hypothetical protein
VVGEVEDRPKGRFDRRHVAVVVHPVKVELEGKVEDGSTAGDEAKEGRGFGKRQCWNRSDSGNG